MILQALVCFDIQFNIICGCYCFLMYTDVHSFPFCLCFLRLDKWYPDAARPLSKCVTVWNVLVNIRFPRAVINGPKLDTIG